ncbi:MAG: ROK family protein [Bacillota bacterium]|nr:ROK family protein [Bacillota bacterium]
MKRIVTFDVGGTFIKWALMEDLAIVEKGKVPTPRTNFEDYLEALKSVVEKFEDIEGLAFSLPGTIDKKNGFIVQGGALEYNHGREYQKEVEAYFGLPISLENDSKSAAICEHEMGALKGIDNGAVIVIGTGLGCTFILNGQVHHGANNSAGEISILLAGDIFKEKFGAFLAEKCSSVSMIRIAKEVLQDETLDGIKFMNLVQEGNEKANEVLDICLSELAKAIFNIQIINDLERVVIGGGISDNELYMERLKEKLTSYYEAFPFPIPRAQIYKAQGGNDANLLGAAITFYKEHE